ncbi:thiamine phosphate synthase [Saccharospirillum impatiens]|uniref:thiamine phosphate synthase n=1 Tax=Saccharospirillum impatiens TaxID=169438 RepID=UPI0004173569|nr:thiamine phosphate synthase [Saccharospirillum impatiens]
MSDQRPIVWSIAGSDSGGGAGIQADVLSITALGGHAATVITSVTAQNSLGLVMAEPVSLAVFRAQLSALADDMPPVAIKIGLLASVEQIDYLIQQLPLWRDRWPGLAVVLDPVAVATSGDALTDRAVFASLHRLLPLVDLVTPNLPELHWLTGCERRAETEQVAAHRLHQDTGAAVLLKGGHDPSTESVTDRCFAHSGHWQLQQPRLNTPHTHGTGCTLSSAWAAARAQGYDLMDAVAIANAFVHDGLQRAYATGQGAGTLVRESVEDLTTLTFADILQASDVSVSNPPFAKLTHTPGVYPVVSDVALLETLLAAGAGTVQLRLKTLDTERLAAQIHQAVELGERYQAQVFINDHWALALEFGAYGVHLGQEDLAGADLAALQRAGTRLGISTHGYAELRRAQRLRPSYIALGHVFPTQTKEMPSQPQGLGRLAQYQRLVGEHCPTVAIGGIKARHLESLAACGVSGVAMVTAITEAESPPQAWRDLNRQWQSLVGGES